MKRIRMVIQYDGTAYVGWQTQPNGLAVQERIERELFKLTGIRTALHASGRTDSGVHALAQVAHFDTESRIPPDKFAYALNAGLPADIRILFSGEAEGFHARFDVLKKHYRYNVQNSAHASAGGIRCADDLLLRMDKGRLPTALRCGGQWFPI